jgi:hypothetical protein
MTRAHRVIVCSVIAVLALAAPASAQRAPDFATLDRGDGWRRVGLDGGLTLLTDDAPYSATLRIELSGQYVLRSGFGFYGAFPISRSFGGEAPGPENATGIGNLDAGVLYVIDGPTLSWVFRGGLGLPTASDGAGAATNFFASFPRFTDVALSQPDSLYVRLAFSPLIHMDHLYLRADFGFDLGLDTGDGDAANELLRLNLGGGYDFGRLAVGLEWVNLYTLDDFGGGEEHWSSLAINIRFMGKSLQPYVAGGLPLDDSLRDFVTFFVASGIQYVWK